MTIEEKLMWIESVRGKLKTINLEHDPLTLEELDAADAALNIAAAICELLQTSFNREEK